MAGEALTAAEELVDIVDEDDRVIGIATRARMRAEGLRHRAVYLLVWSTSGNLLVHRRSLAKDLAPGWWDIAAGGVVASGEDYDDAATRELAEELGLRDVAVERLGDGRFYGTLDDAGGTASGGHRRDDHRVGRGRDVTGRPLRVIGRVYRVVHDGPFTFADGEVIAAEWVAPGRLPAVLASRPFLPDSLALCAPFLRGA